MKYLLAVVSCIAVGSLQAQYYYNDIVGTREITLLQQTYQTANVRMITATGVDKNGTRARDYSEVHEIKENGRLLRVSAIRNLNKTVTLTRFNQQGLPEMITDSAADVQGVTTYTYTSAGLLHKVENNVKDSSKSFDIKETHTWYYDEKGLPTKMWRVIVNGGSMNTTDSLEVRFVTDEDGNTAEERTYRNGKETGYLYYYYDDQHRLLDIVRFNTRLKKLLPDIMYEYDEAGRIAQKTTTTSSAHLGYLIWRYIYDEKGLKTKEVLFNSDKEITGRIDFTYSYY